MIILNKIIDNSQGLSKGLNLLNSDSSFIQDKKSVFLNLISSEIQNLSKFRDSVLDFIKFLKSNGLINKNFKDVSLKQPFIFEKLSDNGFISDLKFLVKRVDNLFSFESLKVLGENLSFDSDLVKKKEISKNIESVLSDLNIFFSNVHYLCNFDILGVDFDSSSRKLNVEKRGKESNIINIDVKNFKKNDSVKEFLHSDFKFRLVDSESAIGRYDIKETFGGLTEFMGDLASSNARHMKESFVSQITDNLMSEWNLKINHNIVNKAKIVLKSNDTGEIRLILKPKKLGSIRINLNLDSNNNLLGKIIVDNHNVRALFEQNMYSINKMLNDNGFNTSLNLSLAGNSSGFFSGDFKDDVKNQGSSFNNEDKIFKIEDDVEISDDLEKSINFIV
ncbi:flagellar hook-length control protein FliK [Borrelia miyamotoi]|uniref:Flagellar hook-length control protein FliK n=1 Tax=Borrelia miyamotoi TaxID=47466 RepID=A0AAQ2WW28_9SPIR|nr:flagellar hook-length control protein FliK [Borrelia miyamotoi]AGT27282.1 flagellar hook-length control protein FliK [Borrelia miyamotoi LB-2001]AJA58465.1 flagellar hook-length control protein [Borrelia miyamotoi]AOW95543.1 flagellar hook-length control protein [Borrelia miyamotoi]QTL83427.1 flagellar hook-length control protein FliK [Borrelia miyamotoi]WAZ85279.1 flagellar hook-length control protein FliK [Borrelia miyamotoi]